MTQWVTAKVNTDVLEKDKDYKVVRYVTDGWDGEYKIQLPDGDTLIVGDEFFYKDSIPTPCDEDEKGFDNLILDWDRETVYYLPCDKMSREQIAFTVKYLKDNSLWDDYGDGYDVVNGFLFDGGNGFVWQTDDTVETGDYDNIETSFNELFVEK